MGIMRYIALLVALFCLAEPVFSIEYFKKDNPIVAIMVDNSSSIRTVEDFEAKKGFLENLLAGEYDDLLPEEARIRKHLFSDTLSEDMELSFDRQQTALGKSIFNLAEYYKDKNLSGIIVASDGLSNYGSDPVSAAKEIGIPIYAVDLGPQRINRDLRIVNINHDPVAYAGRPFEISVEMEGRGFDKVELPLVARSGGDELMRRNVEILGQGQRQRFTVEITPQNPGIHNFSLGLPVQPDEELGENNERNFSLKVLKSKKRVLLVTGKLNWELTFLKRVISASPDYEVDISLTEGGNRISTLRFPPVRDSLYLFDLMVLINCSNQTLAPNLELFDDYVSDQGGSIWYIMGENSSGLISQARIKDVFPYQTHREDRYYNDFPFHISLTEEGKLHPVTRLVESLRENAELWKSIPPFEEHLALTEPQQGSKILAVHPDKEYRGRSVPLIFLSNLGKGKILTFAMGPLWKTGFLNIGFGEDDFAYRQLVNNSINWLTTKEDIEQIRLASNQAIYKSGERVGLKATVLDGNYNPLRNSVIDAVVGAEGRPDSLVVSLVQDSPGRFSADLGLLPAGDYTVKGTVIWEDRILKEVSCEFKVETFSMEEETLFLPPDMMARISQAGGGGYYTIEDFENIAGKLDISARVSGKSSETQLAHNIWILIIMLALLSAEWLIRKRLQLL